MKTISTTHAPQFCSLPITDMRRKFVPAHSTNVAETFRQFAPIHVSAIDVRDDYERTEQSGYLELPGEFA